MTEEKKKEMIILSEKLLGLKTDTIIVRLSFLGKAASALTYQRVFALNGMGTDGEKLYYDPQLVLHSYAETDSGDRLITRTLLHSILHCLFGHSFSFGALDKELWSLAADIAVEAAIAEMDFPEAGLDTDTVLRQKISAIKEHAGGLTAEKLYRYMEASSAAFDEVCDIRPLVQRDLHEMWDKDRAKKSVSDRWKKITELVRTDLKNFSKTNSVGEDFFKNLDKALIKRQDYSELLRQFMVNGETIRLNDEEFDYVYYEYGLSNYGNMPLIEPLEYREEKRISEFAIVIDTSASCRKEKIAEFIRKTYDILSERESFFNRINVHIIQCDDRVQSDDRINSTEDLEAFIRKLKISGFGGTDFRPAFQYIDKLLSEGEFENLKGVIYMTDGYGVFPAARPAYDAIFAFIREEDKYPEVPPWSMGVLI